MTRLAFAVVVLAAIGCGSGENDDAQTTGPSDAGVETESGALPDVTGTPDAEPDVAPDAPLDASDAREGEADVGADADAAPRCPPVAPANLEATFTEKRLSAGATHTCGIRDDGTVACWGGGEAGSIEGYTVPPVGTFVRVAAGNTHTCGIHADGAVECWGTGKTVQRVGEGCDWRECGQSVPPPGPFIEIAAGYDFTCGLRPDFTIECWGGGGRITPPCAQFVQMSVWYGGCAVDADGHVECWPGLPQFVEGNAPLLLETRTFEPRSEPVKQVAVDDDCACYLYSTGESDCWLQRVQPKPYSASIAPWSRAGVAAVSCGRSHACAILLDGTIDCSYSDDPGVPVPIIDGKFAEITCGMGYCCGLRTDGTATCWGGSGADGADMPPGFPAGP